MEHMNKHLTNFNQFAGHFTKSFLPIVDTAIKMSSGEPVSAYGVFKAAKDLSQANKKNKKTQNAAKKANKSKVKKLACAPATKAAKKLQDLNMSGQGKVMKAKAANATKNKTNGKASHTSSGKKGKQSTNTYKGSEVISLVEQLYSEEPKKLTKAEQKKKKDLEDYLAKQLEMDDEAAAGENDSFDSEDISEEEEEDGTYSDSNEYSDEYTIDESGSFTDDETGDAAEDTASYTDQESSSTNEEDNKAAEALAQAILNKNAKKRKSPEATQAKEKTNKTKKLEETKIPTRKSLPATKTDKILAEEPKRRRSSIASLEDFNKKSTPKTTANKVSTTANVKLEPLSPPANIVKLNSIEEGKRAFKWLLNPVTVEDFFAKYWEQKACLIKRQQSNYFGHLISFEAIDQMLLKNHVEFTKNIDVTSYKNGKERIFFKKIKHFKH